MFACGLTEGKIDSDPAEQHPRRGPGEAPEALEKLQSFAMTLRLTEDVGLEVAMGMKDTDAAEDFGDTMAH